MVRTGISSDNIALIVQKNTAYLSGILKDLLWRGIVMNQAQGML